MFTFGLRAHRVPLAGVLLASLAVPSKAAMAAVETSRCTDPASTELALSERYRKDRVEIGASGADCAALTLRVVGPDGDMLLEAGLDVAAPPGGPVELADFLVDGEAWPLRWSPALPPLDDLNEPSLQVADPDEYRAARAANRAALLCVREQPDVAGCYWHNDEAGGFRRVVQVRLARRAESRAWYVPAADGTPIADSKDTYRQGASLALRARKAKDVAAGDALLADAVARLKRARGEVGYYRGQARGLLRWAVHAQSIRAAADLAAQDRAMVAGLASLAALTDDGSVEDAFVDESAGLRLLAWAVANAPFPDSARSPWAGDAQALRDVLPAVTYGQFEARAATAALADGRYGPRGARRFRAILRDRWQTDYDRLNPRGRIGEEAPDAYVTAIFADYGADWETADGGRNLYVHPDLSTSPDPKRNFVTIGAAVAAARPGDVVTIDAGRYAASVTIDKPLLIRGERGVVLDSGKAPGFIIDTDGRVELRFVGIEFRSAAEAPIGIRCDKAGELALRHVHLAADAGTLVDAGSCPLQVFGAGFDGGRSAFLLAANRGSQFEGNTFNDQWKQAVGGHDADPQLFVNEFSGEGAGVRLVDSPRADLRDNRFRGARNVAVGLRSVQRAVLSGNEIGSDQDGVWFGGGGTLVSRENRFAVSGRGLLFAPDAAAELISRGNHFADGQAGIVVVHQESGAEPTISSVEDEFPGVAHGVTHIDAASGVTPDPQQHSVRQ